MGGGTAHQSAGSPHEGQYFGYRIETLWRRWIHQLLPSSLRTWKVGYQDPSGHDDFHIASREMGNTKAHRRWRDGEFVRAAIFNFKIRNRNKMGNGFSSFLNLNGTLKRSESSSSAVLIMESTWKWRVDEYERAEHDFQNGSRDIDKICCTRPSEYKFYVAKIISINS